MSREQLRAFLARVQDTLTLQAAAGLGFEFSGDELLRASGQTFDRVTVTKRDIPGEYS